MFEPIKRTNEEHQEIEGHAHYIDHCRKGQASFRKAVEEDIQSYKDQKEREEMADYIRNYVLRGGK